MSLNYYSQEVDALTSSTNNEASWAGDGWDYSPGFIDVEYATCSTEVNGGLNPNTGDLCLISSGSVMTLSLNGNESTLVCDNGECNAEADGGAKIQEETATGTSQQYWKMTEPDGTQYYFGLNQLPGYASGDQATNSVWTVPVFDAGKYSTRVWRWNLDYVVDMHGDAVAYFYNTQTNYYAEDGGTTGTAAYVQGGVLAKIEYGLRAGSIYGVTPAAQVNFNASTSRQDAPDDLACASGATCPVTSPTFWIDGALTGISTQALAGSSLQAVDSWALTDSYPATEDPTTSPSLWLSSIARTGQDGSTSVALPPTSFAGTPMANRVQTAADTAAGYSLITRFRLTSITNDNGGVVTAFYSSEDSTCAAGNFPSPYSNITACYPDYWFPTGSTTAVEDWFNVYTVDKVTAADTTGGGPSIVTSYTYSGAAWHYNDDTISRSATTTWDQWRGHRTVTIETGTAPDPVIETVDTYLQGMSGDKTGGCTLNCNTTVTVTSSRGDTLTDSDQYAGMLFEQIDYNGAGTGNEVTDTINIVTGTKTATDSTSGLASYMTENSGTHTYTTLTGGGARESTISYTYDSYGRATNEVDVPDTSDATQDTCTSTNYDTDTTNWVLNLPSQVETFSGSACAATSASGVVSDVLYSYNSAEDRTKTQKATAVTGNSGVLSYTYTTVQTATYDEYGRILTSVDADNRTTTTAYTPAANAEPTSVQITDPAGLVTTATYNPVRDLPLTVTDPAGNQTTKAYDALGRTTSLWTPGNPASGPAVDTYTYTVSNTAPAVTTEEAEEPDGTYLTSQTFYDSLGRTRETQNETASGGSDVSDIFYNSDGLQALASSPYYVSGAPSGTLVSATSTSVPSQTGYSYDGAGRVTKAISYALGTETWETDTTYGGNYVTVIPPSGGISQTTFTDSRGLKTAIYQYHAGVTPSPADPSSDYDKTSYTYTPAGQLSSVTDAANNAWSWTYDLLGNEVSESDPDTGTSAATYDAASQLMTETDARGKQLSFTYDADGRKTAEYDTTGGAPESTSDELASWTYDTLAKGELTSSTAYNNGAAYTEQITGYNTYGLPSGSETVIPPAQGALAGTYTQQYNYAPNGQLTSYSDSADGGLPAETVTTGYNSAGQEDSLNGTDSYVNSLTYTNLGQPLQYTMGTSGQPAYVTDSYDPQTGRLTEQNTQTGSSKTSIDDLHYSYDNFGNVTSEADTPAGGSSATDVQCFQYDYLDRLAQAWAQGSAGCASSPSASAEGGAAPYWNSYTYNSVGNLTGITSTTPSGATTTSTDTFPATGSARPHAVSTQTVTTSSGATSASYSYNASGDLTTVSGTSQSEALSWNDAGQLTQLAVTPAGGSAQNTSYVYDADGKLLITADPGTTTLYLTDEELALDTSTRTVTGTRYYSVGATVIGARTGASSVAYLSGDSQGTDTVAIDAATLKVTRRYYDPYGGTRGTAANNFPAGEKGFVGGVNDTATGLTNLGAREYQPGTGSFISPDPQLDAYDPQDLNPYAYAKGNPSTFSDPTGLCTPSPGGYCPPPHQYTGRYDCTGATQAAVNACVAAHEAKSNGSKGSRRGSTSPAIVQISPHIYSTANNPDLQDLEKDWKWACQHFKDPGKNAETEFNAWWHACSFGPWHCQGSMGAAFSLAEPHTAIATGWWEGIKILVGSGGMFVGYFVPISGSTGAMGPEESEGGRPSSQLARALIDMGYDPLPGYQAHHIVPRNSPKAAQAQEILRQYDVGIDTAENGVWLPANSSVKNVFNSVFHNETFEDNYYKWVNRMLARAGSVQDVLDILGSIRDILLSGDTPWRGDPGGGDGGGGGAPDG